jgi:hypothetical protein
MKKFLLRSLIVSLLGMLTLIGCPTDGGGTEPGNDITYTVSVNGDENTTSTRMDFEFSDNVSTLSYSVIEIGSPAEVNLTQLQPTDPKHWSFSLNVWHGGNTTVKINQSGIESGTKNVFIRKPGLEDVDDGIMSGECEEIVELNLLNESPRSFKIIPQFPGVKNSSLCSINSLLEHEVIETDFEDWKNHYYVFNYMGVIEGFGFQWSLPDCTEEYLKVKIRIKYTWHKGFN